MTTATAPAPPAVSAVVTAAAAALGRYAATSDEARRAQRPDAGPALLAALVARHPAAAENARAALVAWLRTNGPARPHPGLFEAGLAGHRLALHTAALAWPQLDGVATSAATALTRLIATAPWTPTPVTTPPASGASARPAAAGPTPATALGWHHYDLISGPAGTALVGVALDDPALITPAVTHLLTLCRHPDLHDLVVGQYQGDELRGWNHGRVNTGLAHGVAGVVAALTSAAPAYLPAAIRDELTAALRTAAWWLVRRSATTADGLVGWPVGIAPMGSGSRAGVSTGHRLSWCYGTPGVSLALWRAGTVLGDDELREFAADAMRSFVATCDPDRQQNGLGLCCGATGVALICDAFHRLAGLTPAAHLRDHLVARTHAGLDQVVDAAADGCGLLSGPGGTLAALLALTPNTPADLARSWLPAIGIPR